MDRQAQPGNCTVFMGEDQYDGTLRERVVLKHKTVLMQFHRIKRQFQALKWQAISDINEGHRSVLVATSDGMASERGSEDARLSEANLSRSVTMVEMTEDHVVTTGKTEVSQELLKWLFRPELALPEFMTLLFAFALRQYHTALQDKPYQCAWVQADAYLRSNYHQHVCKSEIQHLELDGDAVGHAVSGDDVVVLLEQISEKLDTVRKLQPTWGEVHRIQARLQLDAVRVAPSDRIICAYIDYLRHLSRKFTLRGIIESARYGGSPFEKTTAVIERAKEFALKDINEALDFLKESKGLVRELMSSQQLPKAMYYERRDLLQDTPSLPTQVETGQTDLFFLIQKALEEAKDLIKGEEAPRPQVELLHCLEDVDPDGPLSLQQQQDLDPTSPMYQESPSHPRDYPRGSPEGLRTMEDLKEHVRRVRAHGIKKLGGLLSAVNAARTSQEERSLHAIEDHGVKRGRLAEPMCHKLMSGENLIRAMEETDKIIRKLESAFDVRLPKKGESYEYIAPKSIRLRVLYDVRNYLHRKLLAGAALERAVNSSVLLEPHDPRSHFMKCAYNIKALDFDAGADLTPMKQEEVQSRTLNQMRAVQQEVSEAINLIEKSKATRVKLHCFSAFQKPKELYMIDDWCGTCRLITQLHVMEACALGHATRKVLDHDKGISQRILRRLQDVASDSLRKNNIAEPIVFTNLLSAAQNEQLHETLFAHALEAVKKAVHRIAEDMIYQRAAVSVIEADRPDERASEDDNILEVTPSHIARSASSLGSNVDEADLRENLREGGVFMQEDDEPKSGCNCTTMNSFISSRIRTSESTRRRIAQGILDYDEKNLEQSTIEKLGRFEHFWDSKYLRQAANVEVVPIFAASEAAAVSAAAFMDFYANLQDVRLVETFIGEVEVNSRKREYDKKYSRWYSPAATQDERITEVKNMVSGALDMLKHAFHHSKERQREQSLKQRAMTVALLSALAEVQISIVESAQSELQRLQDRQKLLDDFREMSQRSDSVKEEKEDIKEKLRAQKQYVLHAEADSKAAKNDLAAVDRIVKFTEATYARRKQLQEECRRSGCNAKQAGRRVADAVHEMLSDRQEDGVKPTEQQRILVVGCAVGLALVELRDTSTNAEANLLLAIQGMSQQMRRLGGSRVQRAALMGALIGTIHAHARWENDVHEEALEAIRTTIDEHLIAQSDSVRRVRLQIDAYSREEDTRTPISDLFRAVVQKAGAKLHTFMTSVVTLRAASRIGRDVSTAVGLLANAEHIKARERFLGRRLAELLPQQRDVSVQSSPYISQQFTTQMEKGHELKDTLQKSGLMVISDKEVYTEGWSDHRLPGKVTMIEAFASMMYQRPSEYVEAEDDDDLENAGKQPARKYYSREEYNDEARDVARPALYTVNIHVVDAILYEVIYNDEDRQFTDRCEKPQSTNYENGEKLGEMFHKKREDMRKLRDRLDKHRNQLFFTLYDDQKERSNIDSIKAEIKELNSPFRKLTAEQKTKYEQDLERVLKAMGDDVATRGDMISSPKVKELLTNIQNCKLNLRHLIVEFATFLEGLREDYQTLGLGEQRVGVLNVLRIKQECILKDSPESDNTSAESIYIEKLQPAQDSIQLKTDLAVGDVVEIKDQHHDEHREQANFSRAVVVQGVGPGELKVQYSASSSPEPIPDLSRLRLVAQIKWSAPIHHYHDQRLIFPTANRGSISQTVYLPGHVMDMEIEGKGLVPIDECTVEDVKRKIMLKILENAEKAMGNEDVLDPDEDNIGTTYSESFVAHKNVHTSDFAHTISVSIERSHSDDNSRLMTRLEPSRYHRQDINLVYRGRMLDVGDEPILEAAHPQYLPKHRESARSRRRLVEDAKTYINDEPEHVGAKVKTIDDRLKVTKQTKAFLCLLMDGPKENWMDELKDKNRHAHLRNSTRVGWQTTSADDLQWSKVFAGHAILQNRYRHLVDLGINNWDRLKIPTEQYHIHLADLYTLRSQLMIIDAADPQKWPGPPDHKNSIRWRRDVCMALRILGGWSIATTANAQQDPEAASANPAHHGTHLHGRPRHFDPISQARIEALELQYKMVMEAWEEEKESSRERTALDDFNFLLLRTLERRGTPTTSDENDDVQKTSAGWMRGLLGPGGFRACGA